MMRFSIILTLLVALALPAAPAVAATPGTLLRRARRAMAAKKYERALRLLEQASADNPDSSWVLYEHARGLALLRQRGLACELDVYLDDVVERLTAAVELRPALKWKALRDPAFEELAGTALFFAWRGHDLRKGLRRSDLTGIDWHGLQYADRADSISFGDDGRVRYAHSLLPGREGTFRVYRNGVVHVQYKGGSFTLGVSFDGKRAVLEHKGFFVASDHPDECNI
jgi:hypothetical protein